MVFSTFVDAWNTAHNPPNHGNGEVFIDCMITLIPCICLCAFIDIFIAGRFVPGARYFVLHVCTNTINTIMDTRDTITFLGDPARSSTCTTHGCASKIPATLTSAVHLWHIMRYYKKLKPIDVTHHVPALIITFMAKYYAYGPAFNANNFVLPVKILQDTFGGRY